MALVNKNGGKRFKSSRENGIDIACIEMQCCCLIGILVLLSFLCRRIYLIKAICIGVVGDILGLAGSY